MRGVVAHFRELDALVEAIEALKAERFEKVTVYTPTPRHEIAEAVKPPISPVRRVTLIAALAGATFGYWVAIWTSEYWPLVVGGKAFGSWIPYTIISFEMMVLVGGLATVGAMFYYARIPRLVAAVGYDPRFSMADFGIWVEDDPGRLQHAEDLLRRAGATEVRGER
jgi:hypothetical protein